MHNPKVFIGMITFNGQKHLEKAVDSLLNQSFSNLKLFISDDASTDKTEEICRKYAEQDSRIVYHKQEKNIGMFPNFEFVLNKADGDFFMWASQDDIWDKDFVKTCIENIENKKVDFAATVSAGIDSYERNLMEFKEVTKLSGKPSAKQVVKYILQPEIFGKGNLMYSLFKTNVAKKLWRIYPQRMVWGSDYIFSLVAVSHFSTYIDDRTLFKKRHGGFSSPDSTKNDRPNDVHKIIIKNPKNHIFPFGRFKQYFDGHMEALKDTPYRPIAAIVLTIRLPRSFLIYLTERNWKDLWKKLRN
ncbi:MAG: hypothetical protein COU27_02220 [Candidatus Levybacteria bacterium CG10_big_fil_rev_8_21_14_0_10_36_7]|nr:MAG: hypothetical protein COU27_02220 [Candidatus Levybacteria bacterium CG10_big_fil_rev_8_21_14_0_10_36_7]